MVLYNKLLAESHKMESFKFKKWVLKLNIIFMLLMFLLALGLIPSAFESLERFSELRDLVIPMWVIVCLWFSIFIFGYKALLYLPNGVALELHSDHLLISSIRGMKKIPKSEIKGCRNLPNPKGNAGRVEISVSDEYKVRGPFGFKVNPILLGFTIAGENEVTIAKKIRHWRKSESC